MPHMNDGRLEPSSEARQGCTGPGLEPRNKSFSLDAARPPIDSWIMFFTLDRM